ncbi:MAG: glutamate--tRNA ligase family protein [Desulfobacterales bacterium]|nr:glutamate--tRNA ligase family protein [Desulfobacterales bacterium]
MRDPIMYRIKQREPLPHRRRVVHLPDVRLRPLPLRLHRGDHPFDLHAGVREQPPALRLVPGAARPVPRHPQQIEFARLNLSYTVMSKRKLLELVEKGSCRGWDDPQHADAVRDAPPRLHARGDPRPSARRIGVAKNDSMIDMALLENCVREDLNERAPARDGRPPAAQAW